MKITGSYKIKQGNKIIIEKGNLITSMGESFFMNRIVNSELDPLAYIVLGTSPFRVKKSDVALGNETVRKKAVVEIDWNKKQILLYCSCTLSEILNTTEIGTTNGNILVSHDSYSKITPLDIDENIDSFEITYIFEFKTASIKKGWTYYSPGDVGGVQKHIYYLVEENNVILVTDELKNGYHCVKSIAELQNKQGAYYYDIFTKNLYVRTINNESPNNLKVSITTE